MGGRGDFPQEVTFVGSALGSPAGDAAEGPGGGAGGGREHRPSQCGWAQGVGAGGGRAGAGSAASSSLSLQDKLAERKALLLQAVQR